MTRRARNLDDQRIPVLESDPNIGVTDPCRAHTSSSSRVRVRPPSCRIKPIASGGVPTINSAKSDAANTRSTSGVWATIVSGDRNPSSDSGAPITAPGPSTIAGMSSRSAPAYPSSTTDTSATGIPAVTTVVAIASRRSLLAAATWNRWRSDRSPNSATDRSRRRVNSSQIVSTDLARRGEVTPTCNRIAINSSLTRFDRPTPLPEPRDSPWISGPLAG